MKTAARNFIIACAIPLAVAFDTFTSSFSDSDLESLLLLPLLPLLPDTCDYDCVGWVQAILKMALVYCGGITVYVIVEGHRLFWAAASALFYLVLWHAATGWDWDEFRIIELQIAGLAFLGAISAAIVTIAVSRLRRRFH